MNNTKIDELSKEELKALYLDTKSDLETLGKGVMGTLKVLGVKDLFNNDTVGKQILQGLPSLAMNVTVRPKMMAEKFRFLEDAMPLLEKYKYLSEQI